MRPGASSNPRILLLRPNSISPTPPRSHKSYSAQIHKIPSVQINEKPKHIVIKAEEKEFADLNNGHSHYLADAERLRRADLRGSHLCRINSKFNLPPSTLDSASDRNRESAGIRAPPLRQAKRCRRGPPDGAAGGLKLILNFEMLNFELVLRILDPRKSACAAGACVIRRCAVAHLQIREFFPSA